MQNVVIAADAARSDAALASYSLIFLTNQEVVDIAETETLGSQLDDVEKGMEILSQKLRTDLEFDPCEASVRL